MSQPPSPTPAPRGDRSDNSTDPANAANAAFGENGRAEAFPDSTYVGPEQDRAAMRFGEQPFFDTDKGIRP